MEKHILEKMTDIMNNLATANAEEVTELLNYYNGPAVMINGIAHHPFNDPMTAARLNARYHELTGRDHPRFVEQVPIVIDDLLANKDSLLNTGAYIPSYFDRLNQIKNNITKDANGIEITEQHHPLQDFSNVLSHLDTANAEEVAQQLNYYNGPAVMINGIAHHPFNDPMTAARLNARYHELTGRDHPRFVEQVPIVIDDLLANKDSLLNTGAYIPSYFDRLNQIKNNITKDANGIEITEQHHPLQDFSNVLSHLDTANAEEVAQQLNYYNGPAVMINGIAHHPFNDPMTAARFNARYHELTGKDHPRFIEQVPKVIDELLANKESLIQSGAYRPEYFDYLEQIYKAIENNDLTQSAEKGVGR